MSFLLAIDSRHRSPCRDRCDQAAAPLVAAGASATNLIDVPGFALAEVQWPGASVPRTQVHATDDLFVAVDGYVIDGPGTAAAVAEDYRRHGVAALERCDGSFVMAVLEPAAGRAIVINDRSASRSMFAATGGGTLLVAPELKCFQRDAARGDLEAAAILSIVVNCYLFEEMTYWTGVRAVGPARRISVELSGTRWERYWTPPIGEGKTTSVDFGEAVTAAVKEHAGRFQRPVLALSGGVDSRLILAATHRAGLRIPTVTWSYGEADESGTDFDVAATLAERAGNPHRTIRLSAAALPDEAEQIVEASDGLVGHLGAYADRRRLADELGRDFDAILFGDECYRGEGRCTLAHEAIESIGVATAGNPLLRAVSQRLMRREVGAAAMQRYAEHAMQMLEVGKAFRDGQDFHDRLYWQVRLPRLVVGPKALWRRRIEACSPLLAGPLMGIAAALPEEQRVHKTFLRAELEKLAPEWTAIPMAEASSRVKWRRILRQAGPLNKYIVEALLDPLPAFDRWIDRGVLERALAYSLSPESGGLLGTVFTLLNPRRPMHLRPPTILGLLTLKLWLARFDSAESVGDAITVTKPMDRIAR